VTFSTHPEEPASTSSRRHPSARRDVNELQGGKG